MDNENINSMNELFELTSTLRKQVELCRTGNNDKQVFDAVQTINRIDSIFLTMPAKPDVIKSVCNSPKDYVCNVNNDGVCELPTACVYKQTAI
jgi:hypothetical protein